MPYNSPKLIFANKASTSAAASPFVVAILDSGIEWLPALLNACILVFVVSAANSDLYISSRTLYSLALQGSAPSIFARTNARGVPIYALSLSGLLGCIAFLNVSDDSKVVFGYFVNLVTVFGVLTWISILVSHIFFVRARKAQKLSATDMPYTAPLGAAGSVCALGGCIIITLFKNFDVFVGDTFDYRNFITGYLGIPLYLLLIFGYKIIKRTKTILATEADMYGGKRDIESRQHNYGVRVVEGTYHRKARWLYLHTISWIF